MWRCGRWRGGVRFWLLRFEVRTEREKRGPLAGRLQGSAKAHPYTAPICARHYFALFIGG
jgi:hypothetical protein